MEEKTPTQNLLDIITENEKLKKENQVLKQSLQRFKSVFDNYFNHYFQEEVSENSFIIKKLNTSIEDIHLSTRLYNVLRSVKLETLKEIIIFKSAKDMSKQKQMRGFGKTLTTELEEVLLENKLSFGMNILPYLGKN
jgi:DNA-directed RNA polymerase alpha subunit